MILYDYAENSLAIENYILENLASYKTLKEAKAIAEDGWKPFRIVISVEPIEE